MEINFYRYQNETGTYTHHLKIVTDVKSLSDVEGKIIDLILNRHLPADNDNLIAVATDGESCHIFKLIPPSISTGISHTIRRVIPYKTLDKIDPKRQLIEMILGTPIHKDFGKKCFARPESRGTNRFMKYKKLIYRNDYDNYEWFNSVEDRTAYDIMMNYSLFALEELYQDLHSFL